MVLVDVVPRRDGRGRGAQAFEDVELAADDKRAKSARECRLCRTISPRQMEPYPGDENYSLGDLFARRLVCFGRTELLLPYTLDARYFLAFFFRFVFFISPSSSFFFVFLFFSEFYPERSGAR
jgi:hypothetical protein